MNATKKNLSLVKGCSMIPVLRMGDRVELRPVERKTLRCGDIVVFSAADGHEIIHRVIRLSPLQTRGDNCSKDDLPVPEDSPLFLTLSVCRNGKKKTLSSGKAGMREFHRNQIRRKILTFILKVLSLIAGYNPFRVPFKRLNIAVFPGKTVYYAWKYPVAWIDKKGWHWMRFARHFVEAPPKDLHK